MKKLKILYHQLMKKFHYYITQDLDAWEKHWKARKSYWRILNEGIRTICRNTLYWKGF